MIFQDEMLNSDFLADQGLGQAYYNLGVCYQNGKGVVQSQWEANECFKKAKKNGFNIVYY